MAWCFTRHSLVSGLEAEEEAPSACPSETLRETLIAQCTPWHSLVQGLEAEGQAGSSTFPERVTGEPAACAGCSGRKDRDWRFAPVLRMRAFPSRLSHSTALMSQACLHAPGWMQVGLHLSTGRVARMPKRLEHASS